MAPRRAGNGQRHHYQELREAQVPAGAQLQGDPHPSSSTEAKSNQT